MTTVEMSEEKYNHARDERDAYAARVAKLESALELIAATTPLGGWTARMRAQAALLGIEWATKAEVADACGRGSDRARVEEAEGAHVGG